LHAFREFLFITSALVLLPVVLGKIERIFQKQSDVFERVRGRRAGELILFSCVHVETPQSGAFSEWW